MTRRNKITVVILCVCCFFAGILYAYAASFKLPTTVERLNAESRWMNTVYRGLMYAADDSEVYLREPNEENLEVIREELGPAVEVMELCGSYQGYVAKFERPVSPEALTTLTEYPRETYDYLCGLGPEDIASEETIDCINKLSWIIVPPIGSVELAVAGAKLLPIDIESDKSK